MRTSRPLSIPTRPERLNRRESRDETRRRLIDAAAEVFVKRGYSSASVDEIAERAGFSRGAFYSNFSSKEDLLLALLERNHIRDREELDAALDSRLPPGKQLARLKDLTLAQVGRKEMYILFLEFKLAAMRTPPLRTQWMRLQRIHRREVQLKLETLFGQLGAKSKGVTSGILISLAAYLEGINTQCALDPDTLSEREARGYVGLIWDRLTEELEFER
jgi:AcrR family transcriptional regulator